MADDPLAPSSAPDGLRRLPSVRNPASIAVQRERSEIWTK
jgi:hypothetical protein